MKFSYIIIFIIIISILYNCYIIENFNYNKIKIYYFNTSWCEWSRRFNPEWNKFINIIDTSLYEAVNIQCDNVDNNICTTYNVPGFPHIIIETYNKKIIYTGERSANALINFLKTVSNSS